MVYNGLSDKTYSVLTVHFLHGLCKVSWILETDETVAFALVSPLVPDDFRSLEGGEFIECPCEQLVCHIIAEISTEYSEVIIRPILQTEIFPCLATRGPQQLFIFTTSAPIFFRSKGLKGTTCLS